MRTITAKFNSTCAATGQSIKKGETIAYDSHTRKAYKLGNQPKNDEYIQDPGETYYDNFCINNNI